MFLIVKITDQDKSRIKSCKKERRTKRFLVEFSLFLSVFYSPELSFYCAREHSRATCVAMGPSGRPALHAIPKQVLSNQVTDGSEQLPRQV